MPEFIHKAAPPPHDELRVIQRGNTSNPNTGLILMHGRGVSAENMLSILDNIPLSSGCVVAAPQATNKVWFPHQFHENRSTNEPAVSSALAVIETLVHRFDVAYGIPNNRIILAGFSQGAQLVAQFIAEHPAQYGGACIFSGGLIGNDTEVRALFKDQHLLQTPVYLSADPEDSLVPYERFQHTRDFFERCGADLTYREMPTLRHSIPDEGKTYLGKLLQYR